VQIAISLNICVGRCAEEQMIPRLKRAGFDGIDFNFCDLLDRVDWRDDRAVESLLGPWQAAARAAGLPWVQGHGPMFGMFSASPNDERARSLSAPAIRAAARLGVPWMVFHPDVFPGAFDKAHRRAVMERNAAFFRSLLPACEAGGVGIAIENIFDAAGRHGNRGCPRFYGSVPDELCELVDHLDHPLVGACWDTGHARLMNHDQAACLAALGPRLKVLHVQENDGKNDDHVLPFANGRDGVDWDGVVAGLRAAGYAGPFTYETHNAFNAVPEPLLDVALRYGAQVARHLVDRITSDRAGTAARGKGT
jgi:sugar phosphate isomerase/epimerase